MDEEDLYEYISPLWAMLILGNKRYVVDKLVEDNGLDTIKQELKILLWSDKDIEERWDRFRKIIKGMGPAMISEILCKTHPSSHRAGDEDALGYREGISGSHIPTLPQDRI